MSPDMTVVPTSRAMLACAMRRISSLMKAALTPLVPPRGLGHDGRVERQTLAIELNKLLAADVVRQRYLDRLIDAARTAGECALELLRPIGGEDEQDVGVFLQSVHLVEAVR